MDTKRRLIYADTLVGFLKDQREKETGAYSKGRNNGLNVAISAIQNEQICPAVEAAPVVHGRWIPTHCECDAICSVCNTEFDNYTNDVFEDWNYCPNCGAKMDGGADTGSEQGN